MRVENVKDLKEKKERVKSEVKTIDGFPWQLGVSIFNNQLRVVVECLKSEECEVWECTAELEAKLVNHTDYSRSVCQKTPTAVFKQSRSIDFPMEMEFSNVIGDEDIFVDGSFVIETKIVVKDGNGERFRSKPRKPDFFSPSKFSDGIICVEGKKFYISKQILAQASSYFESLFYGDFKESQEKEIVLGDISAEHLLTALEMIYNASECKLINVEYLLMIADRFDIPKIMISVEESLIKYGVPCELPNHVKLLLSDQYKLYALQVSCLEGIRSQNAAREIMNSDSYQHFSKELHDMFVGRLIDFLPKDQNKEPMADDGANDGNNDIESNVIRIRVENVNDLSSEGVMSEVKRINGFPWQLKVYRNQESKYLHAIIQCNKSVECPFWICNVEGKVKLINRNDSTASLCKGFVKKFVAINYRRYSRCDVYICKWKKFFGNENYVDNGSIEVEVTITVKGRSGERFRNNPQMDFFSPSKFSDIIFVVSGKKMHASKQIMAHVSPYFEKLFYGDSEVSQEKEIVMDDISAKEFLFMLEMIYDTRRQCNNDNVEFLLKVADRFEISGLTDRAEKWLTNEDNCYNPRTNLAMHLKLRFAEQYKLEGLRGQCLRDIEDFEEVKDLMNSDSFNHYSSDLKSDLMKKMVELYDGSKQGSSFSSSS